MTHDSWKSTEPPEPIPEPTYHYAVVDGDGVLRTFDTEWDAEAWLQDLTVLALCDFCGHPEHTPDCVYWEGP